MIKPHQIPLPDAEKIIAAGKACKGDGVAVVAAILNAAIEAGVVSPPVYTVRDNHGNLLDYEVYGLWTSPDGAESQIRSDCAAEHWKGQTE